ncbi:MAG: cytochrome c oxidase subunit II [Bryobacteraceae bacterium]
MGYALGVGGKVVTCPEGDLMFVFAALALFQGSTPALPEHRVANIFKPLATPAQSEFDIALFTLALTAAIFVVVAGLIIYTMVRFRRRSDDNTRQEPPQVYGSNQIEVAWTVIPILIVFVLIGVTARVIASVQNASPPPSTLKVTLIGHQWWWEVHYPDFGIVTANEIHVPVSGGGAHTATYLRLESMDVIHSFWVPQLSGKTDLIPNRDNFLWIDPRQPGIYLGNCAEYCGTQHANMLLRVIAQEKDDFNRWAAEQQRPAQQDAQLNQARAAFESLSCVNCHTVRGTPAVGKFGPDLTHLMDRQTIGAGVLSNTATNLRAWVNDPQQAKPGCLMPSMKLTEEELAQVVAYLQGLK